MKSIALVGTNFNIVYKPYAKIDNIHIHDSKTLLDYDIVIIGLNSGIINEYYSYSLDETYNGYPLINENTSRGFIDDIYRRREEIKSLLSIGKNIYFILGDECTCYYHTYEKNISGTGKNAKTTFIVDQIDIAKVLLGEDKIKITNSEGHNINILPNTKLTDFSKKVKEFIYFKSYFKCRFIESAVTTSNKDNVVAGLIKVSNGYKIILPEMVKESSYNKKHEKAYLDDVDFVIDSIRTLDDTLNENCDIPEWVNKIILSNEKSDYLECINIESEIQKLNERKNQIQLNLNKSFQYKKLLYSSGKELENIVQKVFLEIGFSLLPVRINRSDLNLTYKALHFVCEIKGLTKSAGEKNSNQLQKWETEFFEDYEIHPKQILIVNAFREVPLSGRIEDSFPNQMLDYATKKEQCLITTTQLLCFYLCWLQNNKIIDDFVEQLISTNGIFNYYNNWEKYIDEIN